MKWIRGVLLAVMLSLNSLAAQEPQLVGAWAAPRQLGQAQQWAVVEFAPDSTSVSLAVTAEFDSAGNAFLTPEPMLPATKARWSVILDPFGEEHLICVKRDPNPNAMALSNVIHWARVLCQPFRFEENGPGGVTRLRWGTVLFEPLDRAAAVVAGLPGRAE